MRRLAASWLAWSLAALSVIMFVAAIALHVLARSMDSPGETSPEAPGSTKGIVHGVGCLVSQVWQDAA